MTGPQDPTLMQDGPEPGPEAGVLKVWTIYENPSDFPGWFVLRAWRIGRGWVKPEPAQVFLTVESARDHIPAGMVQARRAETDDPCIVESWY